MLHGIRGFVGLLVVAGLAASSVGAAGVVRQITNVRTDDTHQGTLDDAGTYAFGISAADPFGTNPRHAFQVFRWHTTTAVGTQLTTFHGGVEPPFISGPAVSDDGLLLVFAARGDLTGQNADGSVELFAMNPDGSGLVQLTANPSTRFGEIARFAVSGDGSRVVLSSSADYTGGNADGSKELFVVNTDGSGMTQVTALDDDGNEWCSISDDGERIAFVSAGLIQVVNADGTGVRQLTTEPFSLHPQISGDGSTVVFTTFMDLSNPPGLDWCLGGQQIAAIDWDGTNLLKLSGACASTGEQPGSAWFPDVTDDGQLIVYTQDGYPNQDWNVWKINRDATGETILTSDPASCLFAGVSGNGSRVVMVCAGEPFGNANPDMGVELFAMSAAGGAETQLSDGPRWGRSADPAITADGSRIAFVSHAYPIDHPGFREFQVYRIAADGTDLVQLTNLTGSSPRRTSITDDGTTIVYEDDSDPLGTNPDGAWQTFAVQDDGTGLRQLTPDTPDDRGVDGSMIAADGSVVVLDSFADLDGLNPTLQQRIFKVAPDGTGLAVLTPDTRATRLPRVDGSGNWVVYESGGIWRVRTDGSGDEQIAAFAGSFGGPDVSADGTLIVYPADGDPLGTNADGNREIFLYRTAMATTEQLTFTTGGDNDKPSISDDGTVVYFITRAQPFESSATNPRDFARVVIASGALERVEALQPCVLADHVPRIDAGGDGTHAVFDGGRDCSGQNPDGWPEIHLVDRTTPARISPSPGPAPTLVSWEAESGPIRYDVIRGDVADLATGAGSVDLGNVVCLENDSSDLSTRGDEDIVTPSPGQAFFYLFRGSQGVAVGPGSYGAGSSGDERIPGAGGCPD
jgi:Tol biopolymer transport system component